MKDRSTASADAVPPLFSVVVAVRNRADTLARCIDSVAGQTSSRWELIVIDGGSTDGSLQILASKHAAIAFHVSEPDTGIYHAWNKALPHARGEWLLFLGADDYLWDSGVLVQLQARLEGIPETTRVAYGRVAYATAGGEYLYTRGEPWKKVGRRFRDNMSIPHQGVLHRRALFALRGGFDESYRIAGDYEFLLRELLTHDPVFIPLTVAVMPQGGLSEPVASSRLTMREMRRAQRQNGLTWPSPFWLLALARVYLRSALWRMAGERTTRIVLDLGRRLMRQPPYWVKSGLSR